jgi:hypothetical protein
MGNVLSREKLEQVIALGRLGWSLRRIEQATGVRRETAGDYLRSAGIALRSPGGWGHRGPSKPAIRVTTDSEGAEAKPAIEVTTDFLLGKTSSKPDAEGSDSACQPYAELIALELERGRNATGIWQDLVDSHVEQRRRKHVPSFKLSPVKSARSTTALGPWCVIPRVASIGARDCSC